MTRARTRGSNNLEEVYRRLWGAYGPQHWWPARTRAEIVIGAILTQNTAWSHVERATARLRRAKALTFKALHGLRIEALEELIRPAGTFRVKAARLKGFVDRLYDVHGGSLDRLLGGGLEDARERLLSIPGIGPETADAILLYAGGRATFVVDAYTRRVLRRHRLVEADAGYYAVRAFCMDRIRPDSKVYNEYHALLVAVGKSHCRGVARCSGCPLEGMPHDAAL